MFQVRKHLVLIFTYKGEAGNESQYLCWCSTDNISIYRVKVVLKKEKLHLLQEVITVGGKIKIWISLLRQSWKMDPNIRGCSWLNKRNHYWELGSKACLCFEGATFMTGPTCSFMKGLFHYQIVSSTVSTTEIASSFFGSHNKIFSLGLSKLPIVEY